MTIAVEILAAYDGFGERRTGGAGDAAAAIWLNTRATATGAEARLEPVDFNRTAERAGGILAWLAALEALAAMPTRRRRVVALATCGHELGHIGAHRAFAAEPALASASALVLHLGANLGCSGDARLTVRSNVAGLAARMAAALVAAGHPAAPLDVVTGGTANGEAHEIASRGGRYLSLIGNNPWFHAPEDRWPGSIDLARTSAIARAVAAIAAAEAA